MFARLLHGSLLATSRGVDRDRMVREAFPLVHRVAAGLATRLPAQVELSDLTQSGFLGLLDAAAKFDWTKGVKFQTYAELRVRGAILDGLRSLDGVPRSLRRRRRELERTKASLETSIGRAANEEELAAAMAMSVAELRSARARMREAELAADRTETVDPVLPLVCDPRAQDPQTLLERRELEMLLARTIERLSEREKLVVKLYYYEDLTMREVGEVLGVNESRVSQIHSKAIARLRLRLGRDLPPRLARTA